MRDFTYIVKSSPEFSDRIGTMKFQPDDRLWEIDVKDFFMSGEHPFLAATGAQALSPPWRSPFQKLVGFLLQHQYVSDDHNVKRVIAGSGMGLEMSGDMCDYVF